MRRIGFIGTENSHVDHFVRFLNAEDRHPGYRAAALMGGHSERNRSLAEAGKIDLVVDSPEELLGQVDVAVVASRDGACHLKATEPLLRAGLPVLVDKPLAASVADAQSLITAAKESDALLYSGSALRFVPEVAEFAAPHDRGELRQLHVSGPADPDSEYSGLFFYGIHHVEIALELLGNPIVEPDSLQVTTTRHGDTVVALTRIAEIDVVLTFITPEGEHRTPFHAVATGTNGVLARELSLGPDYNAPLLERFIAGIESGHPPATDGALLSPVAVLTAVSEAVAAIGKGSS